MGKSINIKIIFIIVTWNRKQKLDQCLQSIQKYIVSRNRIIIVDNASSDGTKTMMQSRHPGAVLIENTENLGYGRANNIALNYIKKNHLKSGYIVFLNDDAALTDNSLESLIRFLDRRPAFQAAVPAVVHPSGAYQTGIGGYDLSAATVFNYAFFLSLLFPSAFKGFFIHQKYFVKKNLCCEVDWLSGVCLTAKSQAVLKTSGFPEDYFMYAEDIALGKKLRQTGKLIFYPGAQVVHWKGSDRKWNTSWLGSVLDYHETNNPSIAERFLVRFFFTGGFFLRYIFYASLSVWDKTGKYVSKANEVKKYGGYLFLKLWK
jgi:N-acetylglucosaminyl-diphospho-decaprenol L-rhamnosyltransferase